MTSPGVNICALAIQVKQDATSCICQEMLHSDSVEQDYL